MGTFGSAAGQMDTLVLGCTHYVFAQNELQRLLGPGVQLVSTGEPVARQTRHLLTDADQLADPTSPALPAIEWLGTGSATQLATAASRWQI